MSLKALCVGLSLLLLAPLAAANPSYHHVVVVVLENSQYKQIIGSKYAPFINNRLVKGGVSISNAFSEQHPSQPNYYWLFSGSNQGITSDDPPWSTTNPGPVFTASNLWLSLSQKPPSPNFFLGYVDSGTSQPVTNFYEDTNTYATKHVPWLGFSNINNGNPQGVTRDFGSQFPKDAKGFESLPTVAFVTPALNHDMHSYNDDGDSVDNYQESIIAVRTGDRWLEENIWPYAQWAINHDSLLIVTTDEDSTPDWPTPRSQTGGGLRGPLNPDGLTAPNLRFRQTASTSGPNQIPMIFYGAKLARKGHYRLPGRGANNVNVLRTLESFYGLSPSGAQSSLCLEAGLSDGPITAIFKQTP